jgi:hypothetical protein
MLSRTPFSLRSLVLALSLAASTSLWAADPVTDALQKAYAPYRAALYKTNGKSQPEAQQAITQAQAAWAQIVSQFGAQPAAPYDRDSRFGASLAEVTKVYAKAAGEIGNNQLTEAHGTLEHARDVMADLRKRNQVIVFSDHMNAYHAEMEHVLIDGSKMIDEPQGLLRLTALAGGLDYLAKRLSAEAPAELANNGEFVALVNAVEQSVAGLKTALFAQDATAVKAAMSKIKGPYGKLFAKFG